MASELGGSFLFGEALRGERHLSAQAVVDQYDVLKESPAEQGLVLLTAIPQVDPGEPPVLQEL